jgi:SAM-dependent methyltransferase
VLIQAFDTRCVDTKDSRPVTSSDVPVPLTEQQIRDGIRDLAPFRHAIDLPYGLNTFVENAPGQGHRNRIRRWPALLEACGGSIEGLTVLDIACNCGGWSVEAARSGAKRVLGFDVVDRYIAQANFVKAALSEELPQLEFRNLRVEDLSPDTVGTFDITLCFGILYHLQDPVSAMQAVSSVTDRVLFVVTMLHRPPSRWPRRDVNQSLWRMKVRSPRPEHTSTSNLWVDEPRIEFAPTAGAVTDLLRYLGFDKITSLPKRTGEPSGMFIAVR